MSENWKVQVSWKGIDAAGREVMVNLRGETKDEFDALRKAYTPAIEGLKALPVRTFGGPGKGDRKPVVYLPDAPKCPTHDKVCNIREWKNNEGQMIYFWSCGEKDGSGFCRERIDPKPNAQQVAKWRELNGIEAPAPAVATTGNGTKPPVASNGNGTKPSAPATGNKPPVTTGNGAAPAVATTGNNSQSTTGNAPATAVATTGNPDPDPEHCSLHMCRMPRKTTEGVPFHDHIDAEGKRGFCNGVEVRYPVKTQPAR